MSLPFPHVVYCLLPSSQTDPDVPAVVAQEGGLFTVTHYVLEERLSPLELADYREFVALNEQALAALGPDFFGPTEGYFSFDDALLSIDLHREISAIENELTAFHAPSECAPAALRDLYLALEDLPTTSRDFPEVSLQS